MTPVEILSVVVAALLVIGVLAWIGRVVRTPMSPEEREHAAANIIALHVDAQRKALIAKRALHQRAQAAWDARVLREGCAVVFAPFVEFSAAGDSRDGPFVDAVIAIAKASGWALEEYFYNRNAMLFIPAVNSATPAPGPESQ